MTATPTGTRGRTGTASGRAPRGPTATLKVSGEFAFSSDLWLDGHAVGRHPAQPAPARPDPRHRHRAPRWRVPGVLRGAHPRGRARREAYGLEHRDQPVLAVDQVRYQGEPVALVAADHPETARRAAARSSSTTRCCEPVTDPRGAAVRPAGPTPLHPGGTSCGTCRSGGGSPDVDGRRSWSPASTRSACRTRRSSGPSRGWPCRPRTAASTCTSPPSGCTSTATRSRRASACRGRRCG